MSAFFDDSTLHAAKISIEYLTKGSHEMTWNAVLNSGVVMSKKELSRYQLSFDDTYSYKFGLIVQCKGQIVGFALFSDCDSEVFLNHLYVCPSQRFQGIGSKLMKQIRSYASRREISFIDTSNNFMPWMQALEPLERNKLARRLGSFYS